MAQQPQDELLAEIEILAAEMARGAGSILTEHFGRPIKVDYKDEAEKDPVTPADTKSQVFLIASIQERFPDHAVLGEEDDEAADEDAPLPDFVWALDPLDGTKNFVGGLPVYASSIGVLHRGVPVVGAVYVPWPGGDGEVMHARTGSGTVLDGTPVSVRESDGRGGRDLVGLPAGFGSTYRLGSSAKRGLGEPRVTGSIAHELVMTAKGVFEYTVIGDSHLWDVAGGMVLVKEAGGHVMMSRPSSGLASLLSNRTAWQPVETVVDDWGTRTLKDLRSWSGSLLLGSPGSVRFLAENLRRRRPFRRRLHRLAGHWKKRT